MNFRYKLCISACVLIVWIVLIFSFFILKLFPEVELYRNSQVSQFFLLILNVSLNFIQCKDPLRIWDGKILNIQVHCWKQ